MLLDKDEIHTIEIMQLRRERDAALAERDALRQEIENLREGIARAATSILMADARGELSEHAIVDAFRWLQQEGNASDFIADLQRRANDARDQIAIFSGWLDTVNGTISSVTHAAHMPADYEHGLASWINLVLYANYIGAKISPHIMELIESGKLVFPNAPLDRRIAAELFFWRRYAQSVIDQGGNIPTWNDLPQSSRDWYLENVNTRPAAFLKSDND